LDGAHLAFVESVNLSAVETPGELQPSLMSGKWSFTKPSGLLAGGPRHGRENVPQSGPPLFITGALGGPQQKPKQLFGRKIVARLTDVAGVISVASLPCHLRRERPK